MPNRLFTRKLLGTADPADEHIFRRLIETDKDKLLDFEQYQQLWHEAGKVKAFDKIDVKADWKAVEAKVVPYSLHYKRVHWNKYFLRIAALILLSFGLSFGFYKMIMIRKNTVNQPVPSGFSTYRTDGQTKEVQLPDGSKITLNSSSDLTFRDGFGKDSRDVILNGEAFFDVKHNPGLPFRVYSGESVIEVTGTSFSVYQNDGEVRVSVLTGTVLLSSAEKNEKISVMANQSALLSADNDIKIEDRVPANVLSWKTGHLIFEETPIDSALIDIAKHFRRDLELESVIVEKITAEFQDQPLREILGELKLVAGLEFDTTGSALIVRK